MFIYPPFWDGTEAVKLSCSFPNNTTDVSLSRVGNGTDASVAPAAVVQNANNLETPLSLTLCRWNYTNTLFHRNVGENVTIEFIAQGIYGTGNPVSGCPALFLCSVNGAAFASFQVNGFAAGINDTVLNINGVTTNTGIDFFPSTGSVPHHVAFVFRAASLTVDRYMDGNRYGASQVIDNAVGSGSVNLGGQWGTPVQNAGCSVKFFGVRITKASRYSGATYTVPSSLPPSF